MITAIAKIKWLCGKKAVPAVSDELNRYKLNPYEPIFVYKNEGYDLNAWRIIVYNNSLYEDPTKIESISEIRYMSSKAPSDQLQIGKEFELYDGPVLLAEGIITEIRKTK